MHGQNIIYLVNYLEIMAILSSLFLAVPVDKCFLLQNEGAKSSPGSHLIWNINEHGWIIQRSCNPFWFSLYFVKVSTSISQQRCRGSWKVFWEFWIFGRSIWCLGSCTWYLGWFWPVFLNRDVGAKETSATARQTTLSYFLTQQQQRVQQLQGQQNVLLM